MNSVFIEPPRVDASTLVNMLFIMNIVFIAGQIMSSTEFSDSLKSLGLSQRQFAAVARVSPHTVGRWISGSTPLPHMARLLVAAWAKLVELGVTEVPGT